MKTTKTLIVTLTALLLASCGVNSPANSVDQFYNAISNGNAEEAKNVSTQASHKYVDAKLGKTLIPANIECVENGNEANCACLINNDKQEINVLLINGAWKVNQELSYFDQLLNSDFVNGIKNIKEEDIENAMNVISNGVENMDSLSNKVQGIVNNINTKKGQLEATAEKAVEKLTKELKEVETILEKELETN